MRLSENRALATISIVIVLTLLAQVPALNQWIQKAMEQSPHLFTLAEGIVGVILLLFATSGEKRGER